MNSIELKWKETIMPSEKIFMEDKTATKDETRTIVDCCGLRDKNNNRGGSVRREHDDYNHSLDP